MTFPGPSVKRDVRRNGGGGGGGEGKNRMFRKLLANNYLVANLSPNSFIGSHLGWFSGAELPLRRPIYLNPHRVFGREETINVPVKRGGHFLQRGWWGCIGHPCTVVLAVCPFLMRLQCIYSSNSWDVPVTEWKGF